MRKLFYYMIVIILLSQNYKVQAADANPSKPKDAIGFFMFDSYVEESSKEERERIAHYAQVLSKTLNKIDRLKFRELVRTAKTKEKIITLLNTYNPDTAIPGVFYAFMNMAGPTVKHKFYKTKEYLKEYFNENPEFNLGITDSEGDTVAHTAALMGYYEVIQFLEEIGREDLFSAVNLEGETPLMVIFSNNKDFSKSHVDIINLLLKYEGANINKKYQNGNSMLHIIASSEDIKPEILKNFLQREDIIERNPIFKNVTPLMGLIRFYPSSREKLNIFLENAQKNDFINLALTESDPFEYAILNNNISIPLLKKIMEKGDINIATYRSPRGMNPLQIAINALDEDKIKFFIQSGLSISDKFYKSDDFDEGTPIFIYLNRLLDLEKKEKSLPLNSAKIILTLLGQENPKNIIDNSFNGFNVNLFHILMNLKDERFVNQHLEILLRYSPDNRLFNMQEIIPTDKNKLLGDTPLMIAIRNRYFSSVEKLLPLSDLRLINAEGDTYLMLAAKFYDEKIYNLIFSEFKKRPYMLEIENNNGQTYQELIPDYIRKGKALIREEYRAIIARNLQLAKQISEIEKQEELEKRAAADRAEQKSVKADTLDQSASAAEVPQTKTNDSRFIIKRTKKLKKWNDVSKIKDQKNRMSYAEDILKVDGYLEDPLTESDPIRKTRAQFYQDLIAKGKSKEEAVDQIIFGHAVPFIITQIILEEYLLTTPMFGSDQFEITNIPIIYTKNGIIYQGTYEVYGYISSDNRVSIYHELLREMNKIGEISGTSSPEEEQFSWLGRFTHNQEKQSDRIKHIIYDQLTQNSYEFDIKK